MNNFTITSDEVRDIHNGLCSLTAIINQLEDTLNPVIIKELRTARFEIENGFKSARQQSDDRWNRLYNQFEQLQVKHKLKSVWSIYEVEDLDNIAFDLEEGSALVLENFSVPLPVGRVTWLDMWKAANEAIVGVGGDHIFIESFSRSSINPKIILLGTGS